MKTYFISIFLCVFLICACKKEDAKPNSKPLSESIKRVWKAKTVKHNNFTVYQQGAANNTVDGYKNFRLNLTDPSKVILTEFNNDRFNGDWQLVGNTQLILSNLTPEPTYSGGTINYGLTVVGENEIILSQSSLSAKTGNTINEYTLVPE